MKKHLTGALVALFSFIGAYAYDLVQPTYSLKLYPEGQDVDKGIVEDGKAVTFGPSVSNGFKDECYAQANGNTYKVGDEAKIDIYLPAKCNGQMVVVCPGGGYSFCSAANEGTRVADWFIRHDIAVCVVLYRMPERRCQIPLRDVQNAFRYCRHHAEEWGVKEIGVIGFSAGGHLAASASTLFVDAETRPDFSILIYPVITMDGYTHKGTRANLTGNDDVLAGFYSLEKRVTADTPETIIFLSADDRTVDPVNSVRYYRAMLDNKVKGELHIYATGGHGWGFTTTENSGKDNLGDAQRADFFNSLERWLKARQTAL